MSRIIFWEIIDIPDNFLKYKNKINNQFEKALYFWSKWILIDFIMINQNNNITVLPDNIIYTHNSSRIKGISNTFIREEENYMQVRFGKYKHNCSEDFDGKGGILAHGSMSDEEVYKMKYLNLTIHFDASENWIFDDFYPETASKIGYYFYLVSVHEIGHNLGLDHNPDPDSIMYEEYNILKYNATCEDILNIQTIHGIKNKSICIISNKNKKKENLYKLTENILLIILAIGFILLIMKLLNTK